MLVWQGPHNNRCTPLMMLTARALERLTIRCLSRAAVTLASNMGGGTSKPAHKQGVLMIGLDGVGKSTILERVKRAEVITSVPTIGFPVQTLEELSCSQMAIVSWSCGGADKIRPLWYHPLFLLSSHPRNSTAGGTTTSS